MRFINRGDMSIFLTSNTRKKSFFLQKGQSSAWHRLQVKPASDWDLGWGKNHFKSQNHHSIWSQICELRPLRVRNTFLTVLLVQVQALQLKLFQFHNKMCFRLIIRGRYLTEHFKIKYFFCSPTVNCVIGRPRVLRQNSCQASCSHLRLFQSKSPDTTNVLSTVFKFHSNLIFFPSFPEMFSKNLQATKKLDLWPFALGVPAMQF